MARNLVSIVKEKMIEYYAGDSRRVHHFLKVHSFAKLIAEMAKETIVMLVSSIEAYVNADEKKAKSVIEHDDVVDDLFDKVKNELITMIHENPDDGEQACDLLMVAKYLERIGDHATNISEWVHFSITGEHVD